MEYEIYEKITSSTNNDRPPPPAYTSKAAAGASQTATVSKTKTWWGILRPYFKEYCDISSVHCFHYFTDNHLKLYEKAIWLLIFLATSICCIFVYFDLAELYYSQRVQTTVANSVLPVFEVPFPSVGVCLKNRIDWTRLNESAKLFLPDDADNETLQTFFQFFEKMADVKLYTMTRFATLFNSSSNINLTLIDSVDIVKVMEYLAFPCAEVFNSTCSWRFKSYNCCDLFRMERTELGFCYVFNSAISKEMQEKAINDQYYPYHISTAGEKTGLEVKFLSDEEKKQPNWTINNGVYVMIKQPDQWHNDVKFVEFSTYTKIAITSQQTETDERVRYITPEERGCLFTDEKSHPLYKKLPGLLYWRGNCRTRCHQEYVIELCKCNFNLFFPEIKSDNFTNCKPSDLKCIYEHEKTLNLETQIFEKKYVDVDNDSMTCNCLNSCNQLLYHAYYSSFPLEGIDLKNPVKIVHLDIYFQSPFMLRYRTAMRFTFVELLASFGGIIGLFLGASLLSAIEIIYYFTFGLYIRLHKQLELKYSQKSDKCQKPRRRRVRPRMMNVRAFDSKEMQKY